MNTSELLIKYSSIFPYPSFNEIQEDSFNDIFMLSKSIVIKAPTGSGKTVIFEMAVLKALLENMNSTQNLKIIYIAPLKSLCRERYLSWEEKFKVFHPRGIEITGDNEAFIDLSTFQIIYTTPEKLDCITRKMDCFRLDCSKIQLVCIDEVHIINDEIRGVTLEVIVTRLKRLVAKEARFIAVSATIGNIDDFTAWLSRPGIGCSSHQMDNKDRMVELKTLVFPYPRPRDQSLFQFDNILNHKLPDIIGEYSNGKPVLIFCITRKSTTQLATYLVDSTKFNLNPNIIQRLVTISQKVSDGNLRNCILQGIGYHHAGLNQEDRQIVENTFMTGILPVLCSTSTLAMGVNLPAHLVIVKGTRNFSFTSEHIYTQSTLLQMIGRAGRPQFDTSATAIIMTSADDETEINKMLRLSSEMIESHLNVHMTEHLNAEISLKTIENISDIESWIRNTFLFIRCRKNPVFYGLVKNLSSEMVNKTLLDLVMVQLNRLCTSNIVLYSKDSSEIISSDVGHLMARYFINIETMEKILELSSLETLESLIELLSNCSELNDLNLRYSERGAMNSLNRHRGPNKIRFPIKGRIISTPAKINCLVQVILGSQQIKDSSLIQDADRIFRVGNRILRCIHDYLIMLSNNSNNYLTLLNCTILKKCFQAKMWENSWFISQQLPGIGSVLASYLTDAGLNTLNKLANADPKMIEQVLHRHPPFGRKVVDCAASFPKYELNVEQVGEIQDGYCDLDISVKKMSQSSDDEDCGDKFSKDCVIFLIGDQDNNIILKTRITNHQVSQERQFHKRLHVKKASGGGNLHIDLISENYVGFDIRTLFQPTYSNTNSKSSDNPSMDLIDKKPLPNHKRKYNVLNQTSIKNKDIGLINTNKSNDIFNKSCSITSTLVNKGHTIPQTTWQSGALKNDDFTPTIKKSKTFSWKTCEIYKKSNNTIEMVSVYPDNESQNPQKAMDLQLSAQEHQFKSNINGHGLSNKSSTECKIFPNKFNNDDTNITRTKLSYGWESQTDPDASFAQESVLNDSFTVEMSQMEFDQNISQRIESSSVNEHIPSSSTGHNNLKRVDLDATIGSDFLSDDSFNEELSHLEFNLDIVPYDGPISIATDSNIKEGSDTLDSSNIAYTPISDKFGIAGSTVSIANNKSCLKFSPSLMKADQYSKKGEEVVIPLNRHLLDERMKECLSTRNHVGTISQTLTSSDKLIRSKHSYYEQGWDDLFDFITRREIIKASKNDRILIEE